MNEWRDQVRIVVPAAKWEVSRAAIERIVLVVENKGAPRRMNEWGGDVWIIDRSTPPHK
jgi:hypothetical protein